MMTTLLSAVLAVVGHAATRTPPTQALGEVFFGFDSSDVPTRASLQKPVAFAIAHPSARLVLDAHCDPIGTAPYNVALSVRRAEAVRYAMIDMGVPAQQIVLAFYGEDGAPRVTYAEDRRVTVWESRQPVNDIIARTFASGGTGVTWGRPMTVAELAETPSRWVARRDQ